MGEQPGEKLVGKLGFSQQILIRMLGEAAGRDLAATYFDLKFERLWRWKSDFRGLGI